MLSASETDLLLNKLIPSFWSLPGWFNWAVLAQTLLQAYWVNLASLSFSWIVSVWLQTNCSNLFYSSGSFSFSASFCLHQRLVLSLCNPILKNCRGKSVSFLSLCFWYLNVKSVKKTKHNLRHRHGPSIPGFRRQRQAYFQAVCSVVSVIQYSGMYFMVA